MPGRWGVRALPPCARRPGRSRWTASMPGPAGWSQPAVRAAALTQGSPTPGLCGALSSSSVRRSWLRIRWPAGVRRDRSPTTGSARRRRPHPARATRLVAWGAASVGPAGAWVEGSLAGGAGGGTASGGQVGRSTGRAPAEGGVRAPSAGPAACGPVKGCGEGGAGSSRPFPPPTESVQRGSSADHPYRPSLGSTRRSVTDVRIVRYPPNRQIRRGSFDRPHTARRRCAKRRAERGGHADEELFSTAWA
jgi:hypothetical protein